MQIKITKPNRFELIPENIGDRMAIQGVIDAVQKSSKTELYYHGVSTPEYTGEYRVRFNAGGVQKMVTRKIRGSKSICKQYESFGGRNITIKPKGSNAKVDFSFIRYYGYSSHVDVCLKESGKTLVCYGSYCSDCKSARTTFGTDKCQNCTYQNSRA